ncbi:hypothetical protein HMPREF9441_01101 [Paraprevotella clara YIT 11840]|uniref:Uncharacterized protein n=1 Tax=Paraprevotella clara YIT 11840 TaxID=762968 RepID=G5SNT9_9BACT|nr:hypothetical protein HMPREF9441_01101 [Paraprevotella clara YIT 11840]
MAVEYCHAATKVLKKNFHQAFYAEKISRKKITDLTGFFRTFVLLKLT